MDIVYRIIIRDPNDPDRKLGSGPITTATSWESHTELNRTADFSCAFLAVDPQARHVTENVILSMEVIIASQGAIEIGRGEVNKLTTEVDDNGKATIKASGLDMTRRLAERSVGFLDLAGVDASQAIEQIFYTVPGLAAGWTRTAPAGVGTVTYAYSGESLLSALNKITELVPGLFFYHEPPNKITFATTFQDCGIRAIATPPRPDPYSPHTCYIIGTPTVTVDRTEMLTRIKPYGSGERKQAITLAGATLAMPAGYTMNGSENYIAHQPTETAIGRIIERAEKYSDITLVRPDNYAELTDAEKAAIDATATRGAANALAQVALNDLQNRIAPAIYFDLSLLHCNRKIGPGQKIRCIFSYILSGDWVKIDEWLNIIGATLQVDSKGMRTTKLTVATVNRPPRATDNPLIKLYKERSRI